MMTDAEFNVIERVAKAVPTGPLKKAMSISSAQPTDSPIPPEPEFRWGDKVEVRNDKYNDWKKALFCNRNGGLNICLAIGDSMVTGWRHCRRVEW